MFNYLRDTRQMYTGGKRDHCQTPSYALLPILPFLNPDWTIWEPADGGGMLSFALRENGFNVLSTSIDFFTYNSDRWNCIVTNPPFSLSQKWMQRCFELGKPWCLLLKSDNVSNRGTQELISKYGELEMVYPESRINFKMPFKGWATGAQFNTHWYTFGLNIGKPNTWLCPINKEKKEFHKAIKEISNELI